MLIAFLLTCFTAGLYAQEQEGSSEFTPLIIQEAKDSPWQEGKDVPWVPTPDKLVNKMLEIANVSEDDFLVDLGSGDGRFVIAAAKLGARALGIEFNPDLVELSKKNAEAAGVTDRTEFVEADFFEYDFSEATVITMFLLTSINLDLRPRLLELKPGTRILSNTFSMGAWEPDFEATIENDDEVAAGEYVAGWHKALLWTVPAKIEGTWEFQGGKITIHQDFQVFYGTYQTDSATRKIVGGRINGDTITFSIDGAEYTGRLTMDKILEGTVASGAALKNWIAAPIGI